MNNSIVIIFNKLYIKKYINLWKKNIKISRPKLIIPSNLDTIDDIPNNIRIKSNKSSKNFLTKCNFFNNFKLKI